MSVGDVGRVLLADVPTLSDDELMLCIDVLCIALLDDDDAPAIALLKAAMAEDSMRHKRRSHDGSAAVSYTRERRRTKH